MNSIDRCLVCLMFFFLLAAFPKSVVAEVIFASSEISEETNFDFLSLLSGRSQISDEACQWTLSPKWLTYSQAGGTKSATLEIGPVVFGLCSASAQIGSCGGASSIIGGNESTNDEDILTWRLDFFIPPNLTSNTRRCSVFYSFGAAGFASIPVTQPGLGASLSGRLTCNGNPLTNVPVTLGGSQSRTVVTDHFGIYVFDGLIPGGNYTVTPSVTGSDCTFSPRTYENVTEGETTDYTEDDEEEEDTEFDLSITKVEPVQVVYSSASTVPLIAGKPTAVRVTVEVDDLAALAASDVSFIEVQAEFDGFPYPPEVFHKSEFSSSGAHSIMINPQFTPTVLGSKKVIARVDPLDTIDESDDDNNEAERNVVIVRPGGLNVAFYSLIGCNGPLTCYNAPSDFGQTILTSSEFIRTLYPISPTDFVGRPANKAYWLGSPAKERVSYPNGTYSKGTLDDLTTLGYLSVISPEATHSVAIVSRYYFRDYHEMKDTLGLAYILGRGALVVEGGNGVVAAHELGHMLGLDHHSGLIPDGYWAAERQDKTSDGSVPLECFMAEFASSNPWIDESHYVSLEFRIPRFGISFPNSFDFLVTKEGYLQDSSIVQPANSDYLVIAGQIHQDGSFVKSRLALTSIPNNLNVDDPSGNYVVRSVNSAGQTIDDTTVSISFMLDSIPGGTFPVDRAPFVVKIPYYDGTASVEIVKDGQVIVTEFPTSKLLRTALESVPDYGFEHPRQRRVALFNKLSVIEKQIESGNYHAARQNLIHDLRPHIVNWIKSAFPIESALQFSRSQVLVVIDDSIARLGNL